MSISVFQRQNCGWVIMGPRLWSPAHGPQEQKQKQKQKRGCVAYLLRCNLPANAARLTSTRRHLLGLLPFFLTHDLGILRASIFPLPLLAHRFYRSQTPVKASTRKWTPPSRSHYTILSLLLLQDISLSPLFLRPVATALFMVPPFFLSCLVIGRGICGHISAESGFVLASLNNNTEAVQIQQPANPWFLSARYHHPGIMPRLTTRLSQALSESPYKPPLPTSSFPLPTHHDTPRSKAMRIESPSRVRRRQPPEADLHRHLRQDPADRAYGRREQFPPLAQEKQQAIESPIEGGFEVHYSSFFIVFGESSNPGRGPSSWPFVQNRNTTKTPMGVIQHTSSEDEE
ncbi:uncharacterized protein CLUP02_08328 [Colletotrichum lupini]|uniref:Uncharacterized protein n=1 Tax=Colletotrichum lupini TaxID=145971 RepID=A0A9Q8WGI5_9PEZI|nr:uncharacterized protein CLUP02_08328 [Colletotrichum lupini]UQC82838.1 hypothetical protein CLUP02_08328 [Colletotrichum lupini]